MDPISEANVRGTALVRVDLNSPVENGEPQMNERIRQHAKTLEKLAKNHPVVALSHQGRPTRQDFTSLKEHAHLLNRMTDPKVEFLNGLYSEKIIDKINSLEKGEIVLLENTRFSSEETVNRSPEQHAESYLVRRLSKATDFFVNDGFEVCHRSHATVVGFNPIMDSYAGPVLMREHTNNGSIVSKDTGVTKMVLGGSKPSDILRVMHSLGREKVDEFLMGGVPAKLFMKAKGMEIGKDPVVKSKWSQNRSSILKILQKFPEKITLPVDMARGEQHRICEDADNLSSEAEYLDIGDRTSEKYIESLEEADTIFVKGAPGVFEKKNYREGTRRILSYLSESESFTVVGGGDTANALQILNLERSSFNHVSLAGGAYVRALTGEKLPGIEALKRFQNDNAID